MPTNNKQGDAPQDTISAVERFADNGELSHLVIFNAATGEELTDEEDYELFMFLTDNSGTPSQFLKWYMNSQNQ